jgi:hypothetical protein
VIRDYSASRAVSLPDAISLSKSVVHSVVGAFPNGLGCRRWLCDLLESYVPGISANTSDFETREQCPSFHGNSAFLIPRTRLISSNKRGLLAATVSLLKDMDHKRVSPQSPCSDIRKLDGDFIDAGA